MRKYLWLAFLLAAILVPAARADYYIATFACGSGDCLSLPYTYGPFSIPSSESDTVPFTWEALHFPVVFVTPTLNLTHTYLWFVEFSSDSARFVIRDQNAVDDEPIDIAGAAVDCFTPTIPACPYIFLGDPTAQHGPVTFTPLTPEPSCIVLLLAGIGFLSVLGKRLPLHSMRG